MRSPTSVRPPDDEVEDAGAAVRLERRGATIVCTAMAVSGVWGDGFQITESPQTAAIMAFQAQTATGKLKAVMTPTGPSGCHCSYMRWLRPLAVHGQAVELARQADREVGDVDHLLHFALALGEDLADFEGDQAAQLVLVLAQLVADLADDLAAARRRPGPPARKASAETAATRS